MKLKEQLMIYKKMTNPEPQEIKIRETICRSQDIFFESEQEMTLSYHQFLWTQLKIIHKKWWLLQLLLLLALWFIMANIHEDWYIQRSMGIIAPLFVILIIPELWKNRSCQCLEIEAASYYSLRQIYAARLLLFGIADTLLLTIFCQAASQGLQLELSKLMIQFLFPLSITACICFGTLCSKYPLSEATAITLCIIWSAMWLLIILNENIYESITLPIWSALLGLALIYLAIAVYRILKNCNNYWEVSADGIDA